MKENNNEEIKVGDIVKFKEDTYAINDVDRKENLYGALGLVTKRVGSFFEEYYYTCAINKDETVIVPMKNIVKINESQVEEMHPTDYFGEDLIKKYRGDSEEKKRTKKAPIIYSDKEAVIKICEAIIKREEKKLKEEFESLLTGWKPDGSIYHIHPAPFKGKNALDKAVEEELKMFEEKLNKEKNKEAPLSYQVGGTHYKDKAIQPVEYIVANKLDFLEGCIVKRITRHREKLGALDICKIRQECDLILQLEYHTTFEEVIDKQQDNFFHKEWRAAVERKKCGVHPREKSEE